MALRTSWKHLLLASLSIVALAFAACGGDDDDTGGSSSSSSGATGSDAKFVSDICKASKDFGDALTKVSADASLADPKKAMEAFTKPFENFASAFKKANPPKDLKAWHSEASDSLDDIVKKLKSGDESELEAAFSGDNPFPDPPTGAADRLQKLADDNKDCKDAGFTFDEGN